MNNNLLENRCGLCERLVRQPLSIHHLVPREEGGKHGETVALCQPCHSTIHLTFSNRELALHYHTVAQLQQAPALQKYLNWIRSRQIEKISNRRGRR